MKIQKIIKFTSLPVIFASLCCLSPLILVLFGLSTVAFASSLADSLYGDYKWVFRVIGLILLSISVIIYLRKQKGICTIDQAKKRRREIINTALLFLIFGILGYTFFLYVVVHYGGVLLGIWEDYNY
jgi:TctA family transporter